MDKQQYDFIKLLENGVQAPTKKENGDTKDIYCWLYYDQLDRLVEIIGPNYFQDDGGMDAKIQNGCVFMIINDLLEYMGIDPEIFET